jgi:hypothetical protein
MGMKLATGRWELAMRNAVFRLSGVCLASIVGIVDPAVCCPVKTNVQRRP